MSATVASRLTAIRGRLKEAGVDLASLKLMAVVKAQPVERLVEAARAGIHLMGCNYVQESVEYRERLWDEPIEWHFIGHIQTNKAKFLVDYDCVQSIDRVEVAEALDKRLASRSKPMRVLLELNIGAERNKSGIAPETLEKFLLSLKPFSKLRVDGLMCLPPPLEPVERRRAFFARLRELYDRHAKKDGWTTLSMGTSEDYWVAAQEGATLLRIGTALLGPRETQVASAETTQEG